MDLHRVRHRIEQDEERLSPFAARSVNATRSRPEQPSSVRAAFQRDRDRIIHTKAFRRLKHKTQVFIAPQQDHFVTRLTHTFEVAQVGRTIARALRLNEDLAEAIALGHDIGHGPFGHAGEEALAECLPEGFRHNYQSERVLDKLEHDGRGLNLTHEVLDGVRKSSKAREDVLAEGWGIPETLEGQAVKLADALAYLNHDVQDAIRAGLIGEDDLPAVSQRVLGRSHGERLEVLVTDVVESSWAAHRGRTRGGRAAPHRHHEPHCARRRQRAARVHVPEHLPAGRAPRRGGARQEHRAVPLPARQSTTRRPSPRTTPSRTIPSPAAPPISLAG